MQRRVHIIEHTMVLLYSDNVQVLWNKSGVSAVLVHEIHQEFTLENLASGAVGKWTRIDFFPVLLSAFIKYKKDSFFQSLL